MTRRLSHIVLLLTGSILLGLGSVGNVTADTGVCPQQGGLESHFEDDLSFDAYSMVVHPDLMGYGDGEAVLPTASNVERASAPTDDLGTVSTAALPLRAPPAQG